MDNQTLVVSNETFYDEERELFYTYVGKSAPKRELLITAWGKTKEESKELAVSIKYVLESLEK